MQKKIRPKRILITLIIIMFLLFLSKYVSYATKGTNYQADVIKDNANPMIEDDYAKLRALPIENKLNESSLIIDKESGLFDYKKSLIKHIENNNNTYLNIFYNNKDRLVNIIEHDSFYKINEYDVLNDTYDFNAIDYVGSFTLSKDDYKTGKAKRYYKVVDLNIKNSDIYTNYSDIVVNINEQLSRTDGRNVDNSKSNDYNISLLTNNEIKDKDGNTYKRAYIVSGNYTESLMNKDYDFTSVIAYPNDDFNNGQIIFHSNIKAEHYIDNIEEGYSVFRTMINKLNKHKTKEH